MRLVLGIWKGVQSWNQLLLLARRTVAWVTRIETGREQEGAVPSPFLLPLISHYWQNLTESQAGKGKM